MRSGDVLIPYPTGESFLGFLQILSKRLELMDYIFTVR
jgi:hypothetical protein